MKNYGVTDPWAKIPGSKLRAKCFVLAHGLRADCILKGWWMPVKSLAVGAGPHRETIKGLGFLKIKS